MPIGKGRPPSIFATDPTSIVYVIGAGCGAVKIGVARTPSRRVVQVQNGNPAKLKLLHETRRFKRQIAVQIENDVHRRLAPFRIRGEWFCCDLEAVIEAIGSAVVSVRNRRGELAHKPALKRSRSLGRTPLQNSAETVA